MSEHDYHDDHEEWDDDEEEDDDWDEEDPDEYGFVPETPAQDSIDWGPNAEFEWRHCATCRWHTYHVVIGRNASRA